MNKQYRLDGCNFVVAAPLAELLIAHLLLSRESWHKKQQAADISFRLGKAGAEPRQYRARTAAKGCLEAEFLRKVSSRFFDGRHWKYLPAHKRTVNVQHLVSKILSRMGCAAQEHLILHHEQLPTNMFFASRGHRLCFCVVCEWSRRKRNQFASAWESAESKKRNKVFLRYRYLRRRRSAESHKHWSK